MISLPPGPPKTLPTYESALRRRKVALSAAVLTGAIYLAWRLLCTHSGANPLLFTLLFIAELAAYAVFLARSIPVVLTPTTLSSRTFETTATADVIIVVTTESVVQTRLTIRSCQEMVGVNRVICIDGRLDADRAELRSQCQRMGVGWAGADDVAAIGSFVASVTTSLMAVVPAACVAHPDLLLRTGGLFSDPSVGAVTCGALVSGAMGLTGGAGYRLTSDRDIAFQRALDGRNAASALHGPLVARTVALRALPSLVIGGANPMLAIGRQLQTDGLSIRVATDALASRRAPWTEEQALQERAHSISGRLDLDELDGPTASSADGLVRLPYLLAVAEIVAAPVRLALLLLPALVALTGWLPLTTSIPSYLLFGGMWFGTAAVARKIVHETSEPTGAGLRRDMRSLATDLQLLITRTPPPPGRAIVGQTWLGGVIVVAALIAAMTQTIGFSLQTVSDSAQIVLIAVSLSMLWLARDLMWATTDRQRRALARAELEPIDDALMRVLELSPLGLDVVDRSAWFDGEVVEVALRLPLPGRRVWRRMLPARVERSYATEHGHVAYVRFDMTPADFDELLYYCMVTAPVAKRSGIELAPIDGVHRTGSETVTLPTYGFQNPQVPDLDYDRLWVEA